MNSNLIAILLLAVAAPAADVKSPESIDTTAAFSRLKSLAGEWEADSPMGKIHTSFELIGGGTAIVERDHHDKMPDMLTVYHMDGKRLMLTHYCMAGNQPTMRGTYVPESKTITFNFVRATNLKSPNDGHMHHAVYTFLDSDHFQTRWTFQKDGKDAFTEDVTYVRTK